MSEVQFRRGRIGELDALVDLWMRMMHEHEAMDPIIRLTPQAAQHYRSYLHTHMLDTGALVLAALEGSRIVGFTLAMRCQNLPMFQPEHYGYISDMAVLPSHRSLGVGRQMLDRVNEWFKRQGVRCVQLQVYTGNDGGQRFWSKSGFRPFLSRMWMDL